VTWKKLDKRVDAFVQRKGRLIGSRLFILDPSLSSRSRWSSDGHRDSGVLASMLDGDGRQLFVARCPRFRKGMLLRRLKQLLAVKGVNSRQQHGRVAAFSEWEVVVFCLAYDVTFGGGLYVFISGSIKRTRDLVHGSRPLSKMEGTSLRKLK
jgi:hypothetical protein